MDDQTKTSYGYDPFKNQGRDRWALQGKPKQVPPSIPNYDVIDFLGEGGMATVWSAKYRPLNHPRALKVLSEAVAIDSAFLERFGEEAKALARLEHPNIVKVYDASMDYVRPYLAMDFVAGQTLHELLKTRNLTSAEAIKYFKNIADALDYAHGLGFVHRDIKASNVMIANSGNAMLIDFGVSSWLGGVGERANTMTGTLRYMSPEACRGERVTKASDLWAFGVLMYRALTGAMPFEGKSEQEIMEAIVHNPPKEPKHPNPRVREFLKRMLVKDPSRRPASASAMAAEYARLLRPFALKAHRDGIAVGASFLLAGLVVLGVVGGVVGYVMTRKAGSKEVVYVSRGSKSGHAGSAISKSSGAGSATGGAAGVTTQNLSGVWYAGYGSQWAEIRIDATSDQKFHAMIDKRDQGGGQTVEADGEMSGNKITYREDAGHGKTSFVGEMNADHSRVTGKLTTSEGEGVDGEWVRASAIAMTPSENSEMGFSLLVPAGWQANTGDTVSISPIGRPDVIFSVASAPLNGAQNVQDVLKAREDALSAVNNKGGSYINVGANYSASLGGKQGTAWELTYQESGGAKQHAKIFCTIRGDSSTIVETWWPNSEEEIWSPVLDLMRQNFRFAN